MNTIIRSSFRSIRSLASLSTPLKSIQNRTIFHMVSNQNRQGFASIPALQLNNPSFNCKCGCAGMSKIHTKGNWKSFEIEVIRCVSQSSDLFQESANWLSFLPKRLSPNERHRSRRLCQQTLMALKWSWMEPRSSSSKKLERKSKWFNTKIIQ